VTEKQPERTPAMQAMLILAAAVTVLVIVYLAPRLPYRRIARALVVTVAVGLLLASYALALPH
jgi:multisubunit Na+/H+ antiporter MnhB subunit